MISRNKYMRVTRWEVPPHTSAASLRLLVFVCRPVYMVEGYLLEDIQVGEAIRFKATFRLGQPYHRTYRSSRVVCVEGEFVMTEKSLFQILRVPPTTPLLEEPIIWITEESSFQGSSPSVTRRARIPYVRATVYSVPQNSGYPDLSTLALLGYQFAEVEGFLHPRPRRGGRLKIYADDGGIRLLHESARIWCRQGNYFLTSCLYHLQKIPHS